MIEWDRLCIHRITGRKVWIIRKAQYEGGPRTWSIVAIRKNWWSKRLLLCAAEGLRTRQDIRELIGSVKSRGFTSATAERKGRIKSYTEGRSGLSINL